MKQLNVCILWHMHQPDYRDPVSGLTLLPWTWLHAVKDYGEMLRTMAGIEAARITFNLVPVLVEQLDRYARGEVQDLWLELARRDPRDLDDDERRFLVDRFFTVHAERHILPNRRYRELARKKETGGAGEFREKDLRDLQVWFLLSWTGHHLRQEPPVKELLAKQEGFSEAEKAGLLDRLDAEVAGILPLYRQLEEEGRIEISFTPYAHPILPLLCNTAIAAEASPATTLPATGFRHPEDARLQIRRGRDLIQHYLGVRPRGMWPAEGAVSEEALQLMIDEDIPWAASDEGILHRSLPGGLRNRKDLYRPYSYRGLPLIFRDLELSDRIGFVYAHWKPKRAAEDLIGHLERAAEQAPGGLLALVLDGENCWESYEENGYPFLRTLYEGIGASSRLRLTTVSEALHHCRTRSLKRLAPGSWINSDFHIWIGHPEENRAWELLARARSETFGDQAPQPDDRRSDHLLRAEGSDWFWWYGDDHASAQADTFDLLFRRHLEALYLATGRSAPPELKQPIKPPVSKRRRLREPTALFTPTINGQAGDYFEWLAAGRASLTGGGAMHPRDQLFTSLLFGYDLKHLFLRLDPHAHQDDLLEEGHHLDIHLTAADAWLARFVPKSGEVFLYRAGDSRIVGRGKGAVEQVVELAIPLAPLELKAGDVLLLSLHLCEQDREMARWPVEAPLEIPYRGTLLEADEWYV
ncbi:alpha-amylase/alpha-mannosidase (GH57 family) [Geothermobacter ehrlichii]|uniref:Alpha-amylase/alpha-mannosidase (GH57 family) n=1 Tax=Geothermobacter ehrlichii TaxID=213224 RepID=A0A5D3WN99_9BACT|nr:glycoside hydrolase family 57 protein [Geothermobacter ehrlichii]TYO99070.1 alpha-amylase/alpha-mannosidase (GH57 family) [Geothermobacter ehrlichii]